MTHSIELILDRLGTDGQPPLSDALIELTDFATIRRYQEGDEILTDDLPGSSLSRHATLQVGD